MKKLLAIIMFCLIITNASAQAKFYVDNTTTIRLDDSENSCFQDSEFGLFNLVADYKNSSVCTGTYTGQAPSYCRESMFIYNPFQEVVPVSIQIVPTWEDMTCPAPEFENITASVRFIPQSTSAPSFFQPDLNECWGWWCNSTQEVEELRCPFGWDSLGFLGALGGCSRVNVTISNSIEKCPTFTFTMQPQDYRGQLIWGYQQDPDNDVDVPYTLKIKGYVTDYTSSETITYDNKTLSDSVSSLVTGMENIVNVNTNLLGLLYMIFEIIIIIVAFIGLPTLIIILIKWAWEVITGRPFGFRQGGNK